MRLFVFLLALALSPVCAQITTAPTPTPVTPVNLMPPSKVYINPIMIPPAFRGYIDRKVVYGGCNTGVAGGLANDNGGPGVGYYSGCNATNAQLRDTSGNNAGAFRIFCSFVKIAFDDPIVHPGQAGQTHGHAFYGNDTTDFRTNVNKMDELGGSSCGGGIVNRTGYWAPFFVVECPVDVPSVCTAAADHGRPIVAPVGNFYYKSSDFTQPVTGWPTKGLRIIAGDPLWTGSTTAIGDEIGIGAPSSVSQPGVYPVYYECWNSNTGNPVGLGEGSTPNIGDTLAYRFDHIPTTAEALALAAAFGGGANHDCNVVKMNIDFPKCMKATDLLDSPDHRSHMAYPNFALPPGTACPTGFTARMIPSIEGLFHFTIAPALLDHVRLSSDYSKAGAIAANLPCAVSAKNYCAGVTGHMDWVNGWDQTNGVGDGTPVPQQIIRNCYPSPGDHRGRNCSDSVIGDIFQDGRNYILGF